MRQGPVKVSLKEFNITTTVLETDCARASSVIQSCVASIDDYEAKRFQEAERKYKVNQFRANGPPLESGIIETTGSYWTKELRKPDFGKMVVREEQEAFGRFGNVK